MDYQEFLKSKRIAKEPDGFEPTFLPGCMKPFQKHLSEWNVRQGRSADFASCGLGKSLLSLVWAQNVVEKTNKPTLILAPLAVSRQFVKEGEKFGIPCRQTQDGTLHKGINVTNYERLRRFDPSKISGVVADEVSCIKNADGKTRREVTDFMSKVRYRLIGSATPAPNDYMELGVSSEVLGVMGRNQMLAMFFTNGQEDTQQWALKGHAKTRFWQWMASWARAVQKPSDLGDFDDKEYMLPELKVHQHVVPSGRKGEGFLPYTAKTLHDLRAECHRTLKERCRLVSDLLPRDKPCIAWCNLNVEGELLAKLIPGAVNVQGSDSVEVKEERLIGFCEGKHRVLVSKAKIAGFGLNLQHCADMAYFPSFSHERYFQAVRRCWRFGQRKKVNCHLVASSAESRVTEAMIRKERQSVEMYEGIVRSMMSAIRTEERNGHIPMRVPSWLSRQ